MRRFTLAEVARGAVSQDEICARRTLLQAHRPLEEVVRERRGSMGHGERGSSELSSYVTERFRLQCLENNSVIRLYEPLAAVVELGLEDAGDAVFDKTARRPPVEVSLEECGRGDVATHLLRFAVAELAKNMGEAGGRVRVAVATPNAVIVRMENAGRLPDRQDWFVSGGEEEQVGYAYGGAHGAAARGMGVGLQMAVCALKAFGGAVSVRQSGVDTVTTDVVLMRRSLGALL